MTATAPDDHFTAGPDCRVSASAHRRVSDAGSCPTICVGIVSSTGVEKIVATVPAPHNHFIAGPSCRVAGSGTGRVGRAGSCPTIGVGIVFPACVKLADVVVVPAPYDHFIAG